MLSKFFGQSAQKWLIFPIKARYARGLFSKKHLANGNFAATIRLLLELGDDKNVPDNTGRTPLDYATEHNLEDLIPLLA